MYEGHDRLRRDLSAFRMGEFRAGLLTGLVALALGFGLWQWSRWQAQRRGTIGKRILPFGGWLATAAYVESLRETGHLLPWAALGLALLAGGGELADRRHFGVIGRGAAAAPGAVVLATAAGLDVVPVWVRVLVVVTTIAVAVLVADLERRVAPTGLGLVLIALTVVGVYETVPEPGLVLPLLVTALLGALLAWPIPLVSLGGSGAAVVGAIVWAAAIGGRGRLGSVVAAVACFGLFLAEPMARFIARRPRGLADRVKVGGKAVPLFATGHLAVVYIASRVAGLRHRLLQAIAIAAIDIAVATILAVAATHLFSSHEDSEATALEPVAEAERSS